MTETHSGSPDAHPNGPTFVEIKVARGGRSLCAVDSAGREHQLFCYTALPHDLAAHAIPPFVGVAHPDDGVPAWPAYVISFIERYLPIMYAEGLKIDPGIQQDVDYQDRTGTHAGRQVTYRRWPLYYVGEGHDLKEKSKFPALFDVASTDLEPLPDPPERPQYPGITYGP